MSEEEQWTDGRRSGSIVNDYNNKTATAALVMVLLWCDLVYAVRCGVG